MIQNVESKVSYVLQCGNAEGGMDKPYYNTANDYVKVFLRSTSKWGIVEERHGRTDGLFVTHISSYIRYVGTKMGMTESE